jgi:SHS2 domain-containing protein
VSYRWVDHTAEVELHVEAPTPEVVFTEATQALAELLDGGGGEPESHEVSLEARDLPALLVAWLEELLFLADTGGFVADDAEVELREKALHAVARGRKTEPRPLVKAVTYHGLEFEPAGDGWRAKVVLDV